MAIYKYRCQTCEAVHEVWAKMGDPAPAACEACGVEGSLTKLLSKTAFHLKGGGWYAQGYGGGGKGATKSEPASGTSAPASDSGGGGDSSGSGDSAAPASTPSASSGDD